MQEVRVESLDGLEVRGSELRLSANAGRLRIVFPREVWDLVLMSAEASEEPDAAELEELYDLHNDPSESHNLATSPDADPTLRRFRATLDRIFQERAPPRPAFDYSSTIGFPADTLSSDCNCHLRAHTLTPLAIRCREPSKVE